MDRRRKQSSPVRFQRISTAESPAVMENNCSDHDFADVALNATIVKSDKYRRNRTSQSASQKSKGKKRQLDTRLPETGKIDVERSLVSTAIVEINATRKPWKSLSQNRQSETEIVIPETSSSDCSDTDHSIQSGVGEYGKKRSDVVKSVRVKDPIEDNFSDDPMTALAKFRKSRVVASTVSEPKRTTRVKHPRSIHKIEAAKPNLDSLKCALAKDVCFLPRKSNETATLPALKRNIDINGVEEDSDDLPDFSFNCSEFLGSSGKKKRKQQQKQQTGSFDAVLQNWKSPEGKSLNAAKLIDSIISQVDYVPSSQLEETDKNQSEIFVGDHVLAYYLGDKKYHPAIIKEINISNARPSYRVQYWDSRMGSLQRNKILGKQDSKFFTVQVSESFDPDHVASLMMGDQELLEECEKHLNQIEKIHRGQDRNCERLKLYKQGGRQRRLLLHKSGTGGFTQHQQGLIMRFLNERFSSFEDNDLGDDSVPQNIRDENSVIEKGEMPSYEFDTVNMIGLVLLPELMIRILQSKKGISTGDAEQIMLKGDPRVDWAKKLMAFRQMFRGNYL